LASSMARSGLSVSGTTLDASLRWHDERLL
jgi:hypothetical protein